MTPLPVLSTSRWSVTYVADQQLRVGVRAEILNPASGHEEQPRFCLRDLTVLKRVFSELVVGEFPVSLRIRAPRSQLALVQEFQVFP